MPTLTIDIGNTTIAFGVFAGDNLIRHFKVPTHKKNKIFYKRALTKALGRDKVNIDKIIVCSVVPDVVGKIYSLIREMFNKKPILIGRDLIVPIKNKYKIPAQVGQDRLVNAYAGLKLYGPGLIIVDFGTAITFDVVSNKAEYLGGLIFPGIDLSLDALYLRTALLPRIKIKKPTSLVGRDTTSSINNGIVFGVAGVCDNVIERLRKKYKDYRVVTTGGNAKFIKLFSKKAKNIRPYLILEGLNFLSC